MSQNTMPACSSGTPNIALVSFDSLGDSLIYIMMAENLYLNGFDVTYYGSVGFQLRRWLPQLQLRPYPAHERFEDELEGYDLVICSPPRFIREVMTEECAARLREKWILVCQKAPLHWSFDHTERIRKAQTAEAFRRLEPLLDCSGSIRHKPFATESVVEMTISYMREKMHLQTVTKEVLISPPKELRHRRFKKRVVISPDSAGPEKKNWSAQRFLRLAHRLRAHGYCPEIVVAPENHSAWATMKGNIFPTPKFSDLERLSAYIYESGSVIANDSGNGHLASFLNIPVVTIYRKRNPSFHWRPDWKPGIVVCPWLNIRWRKNILWKPFISINRIMSALKTIVTQ